MIVREMIFRLIYRDINCQESIFEFLNLFIQKLKIYLIVDCDSLLFALFSNFIECRVFNYIDVNSIENNIDE